MAKRMSLAAAALLAFAAVVLWVHVGAPGAVEQAVYGWLSARASNPLTAAAKAVTWFCNPSTVAGISLLLLLWPRTRRTIALPFAATGALAGIMNSLLKGLFGRPRPDPARHLIVEHGLSFPSGHSMTSAALGTLCVCLALYYRRGRKAQWWVWLPGAVMPVLIGLSRVYLGVHYITDVLAGWSVGISLGLLTALFWERNETIFWEQIAQWRK